MPWCKRTGLITLTQNIPDYNEYEYGAKAATSEFFCAVTRNKGFEYIVHATV